MSKLLLHTTERGIREGNRGKRERGRKVRKEKNKVRQNAERGGKSTQI